MSVVDAELVQILRSTLSDRAEVRRAAENAFLQNWLPRPTHLFPQLLEILLNETGSFGAEEQKLAAVFFRRWISRESQVDNATANSPVASWNELPEELQAACKSGLLEAFRRATHNQGVRNRIADVIGQIATLVSIYEEWQDLMKLCVDVLQGQSTEEESLTAKVAVLRIIEGCPELLANQNASGLTHMVTLIGNNANHPKLAVECVQTLTSLAIYFHADGGRRNAFLSISTSILPGVIHLLKSSGLDEGLAQAFNSAADLVFEAPKLFTPSAKKSGCLGDYLTLIGQLLNTEGEKMKQDPEITDDEADEVISAALEFVCAAFEGNPGAFRRDRALLTTTTLILLKVTGMQGDSGEWLKTDPTDEQDVVTLSVLGQQSLDRFAMCLGGVSAGPLLFQYVGQMLAGSLSGSEGAFFDPLSAWQMKYAALMAVASTAEGCAEGFLEDHLGGLLVLLWPAFRATGPGSARVQYAACHALGQLCTDFPGRIQAEFATDALSALITLLQAPGVPARVQCHAAAALVNFAEGCEAETLDPFLDGILRSLAGLLASSETGNVPDYLKEQLLPTIASYSGAAQSRVLPYLEGLLPLLLSCAQSTTRVVECRGIEAITMLLLAIKQQIRDPSSFSSTFPSAYSTVQSTLPAFLNHLKGLEESLPSCPADDQMREFLPSAWLRMAQLLGSSGFLPWVPTILPGLLRVAGAELQLTELPEEDEDEEAAAQYIPTTRVNGRHLGINTSALEEKAGALETLAALIEALTESGTEISGEMVSALQLPTCLHIAQGLVNFEWSGDVRIGSVEVGVAVLKALQVPAEAVESFLASLLQGLEELWESEYARAALDAMSSLVSCSKGSGFSPSTSMALQRLLQILPAILETCLGNISEAMARQASRAQDDEEAGGEEEGEEVDEAAAYQDIADEEEVLYAWGRLEASLFESLNYEELASAHLPWIFQFTSQYLHKTLSKSRGKGSSASSAASTNTTSEALQHVALGVLSDGVDKLLPRNPAPFISAFGQGLIDACLLGATSEKASPLIKQMAIHLGGKLVQRGGDVFKEFALQALNPLLHQLLSRPDARIASQMGLSDCCVMALLRIHQAYPGALAADTSDFISRVLITSLPQCLPVVSDEDVIPVFTQFLLESYSEQAVWAPAVRSALLAVRTSPTAMTAIRESAQGAELMDLLKKL